MRIIDVQDIGSIIESIRPKTNDNVRQKVLSIISDVRKRKDKALKEYETKFSGVKINSLKVTTQEIKSAYSKVGKDQIEETRSVTGCRFGTNEEMSFSFFRERNSPIRGYRPA